MHMCTLGNKTSNSVDPPRSCWGVAQQQAASQSKLDPSHLADMCQDPAQWHLNVCKITVSVCLLEVYEFYVFYVFYAFYGFWIYFQQSGALTFSCHSCQQFTKALTWDTGTLWLSANCASVVCRLCIIQVSASSFQVVLPWNNSMAMSLWRGGTSGGLTPQGPKLRRLGVSNPQLEWSAQGTKGKVWE